MIKILDDLKEKEEDYFQHIDWFSILNTGFLVVLIVMNAFYILGTLVSYTKGISIDSLATGGLISYTISILGLGYYLSHHFNSRELIRLGLGYLIYLGASYFIFLTSLINNPEFKSGETFSQDFWEIRYLWSLALIIGVAILLKMVFKQWYSDSLDHFQVPSTVLVSGLLTLVILCDSRLFKVMMTMLEPVLNNGDVSQVTSELFKTIWTFIVYFWPIAFVVTKSMTDIRQNKASLSLAISSSLLFALIFNYTLQMGVKGNGAYYGYFVYEGALLYQFLFLFTFFILFYCLVNRYIVVTLMIGLIGTLASIVNTMKVSMRSEPLLITDLVWLKQLDLLFGFVDGSFLFNIIVSLVLAGLAGYFLTKYVLRGKVIANLVVRLGVLAGLLLFINSVMTIFRNEDFNKVKDDIPIVSVLNNRHDVNWLGFEFNARMKSLAFVWSKQLSKHLMTKPNNYNQKTIDELYDKYTTLAKDINKKRTENIQDQTVIYILSESFANPAHLDNITLSEDPIPYINGLLGQTTSGLMKSDFYGGGTANMEFQSLTGLPFYNYSPSIAIAYTEIVPKLAYMPSISDQFDAKARIAMHPANAKNYDRYNVYYNVLGFEKFLANDGTKETFTHPEPVGVYVGDKVVYDNILEQLDRTQNQFFSIITMQNHTPWSANGPVELVATGKDFTETEAKNLLSYTRLLRHTDMATKDFLAKLKTIDKKITVVFYGDHLPGVYPMSVFDKNPETQYQTDYFIWSNFKENKLDYPLVNSSDFTAELLEHTDSKVSPYYALLTEVLHKASVDKALDKLTPEQEAVANDLKLLQYDLSSGKGYILNHSDFFEILP